MTEDHPAELDLVAKRLDFLERLAEESARKRVLVEDLGHSRSTVNRAMARLQEADLVQERPDGTYETTLLGRLLAEKYRTHLEESSDLLDGREILEPVSPDSHLDEALLVGAETFLAEGPTPREPLRVVENAIRGADSVRIAMPVLINPRNLELCRNVAVEGGSVELVVSPELLERLESGYMDHLSDLETSGATISTADPPAFSLIVTERDDRRRALAVIFTEHTGVHGVVHNDAEHAVDWATRTLDRIAETATEQDLADRAPEAGVGIGDDRNVVTDGAVTPGGTSGTIERETVTDQVGEVVEYTLECEGFVRLTDEYFERREPADPATCLRTGFDIVDVRAGLALERDRPTDDGREPLAGALVDRLESGTDAALLGPPGSGKSTVCRTVACRWDEDVGTVLYRDGGDRPFESTAALERSIRAIDDPTLVVVEDALSDAANDVFEVAESFRGDDSVSFLFETRDDEWSDPGSTLRDPRVDADRRENVETVRIPRLDETECRRLVEHVSDLVSETVEVSPDELLDAVREGRTVDDRTATPGEMLLAWHVLARRSGVAVDPSRDAPTALDADVARAVETVADAEIEGTTEVALLANLLNAAGHPVTPAYLHSLATDGDHRRIEQARSLLVGPVLCEPTDGATTTYRVPHRTWSRRFLARLAKRDDLPVAFGETVTALLDLADDSGRRESIADAVDGHTPHLTEIDLDPAGWALSLAKDVYDVGIRLPATATWFGTPDAPVVDLPEACPDTVPAECALARTKLYFAAGESDRARRECLALIDPDLAPPPIRDEAGLGSITEGLTADQRRRYAAVALRELAHLGQRQAEYDRARSFAEASLELSEELGDDEGAGEALNALGGVAWGRGDLDEAERRYQEALERSRAVDDTKNVGNVLTNLAMVARARNDLEGAEEYERESLERYRDARNVTGTIEARTGLGLTLLHRGKLGAAAEQLERAVSRAWDAGADHAAATAAINLAAVETATGDYEAAERRIERACSVYRRGDARQKKIACRANRADLELAQGDPEAALETATEALELARETDKPDYAAAILRSRAKIHLEQGSHDAALEDANRALEVARETEPRTLSRRLAVRGQVRLAMDDREAARADFEDALERARQSGDRRAIATARLGLGRVACREDDPERAVALLRDAAEEFADIGAIPEAIEAYRRLADAAADADDGSLATECEERIDDLAAGTDVARPPLD